ncbi:MAG: hypothetical protein NVS9B7_23280 [Flavisolibacter sp.]
MKMQLTSMLILMGASFSMFTGCKKHHESADITITETFTNKTVNKDGTLTFTGTFTATGGITTSGTNVMNTTLTPDSSFCIVVLSAPEGTFTTHQNCSRPNMTGHWDIVSGTGIYKYLHGSGPLTMMFPPNVPTGVQLIEKETGEILWMK